MRFKAVSQIKFSMASVDWINDLYCTNWNVDYFSFTLFGARYRTGLVSEGFDWHIGAYTPAHCSR